MRLTLEFIVGRLALSPHHACRTPVVAFRFLEYPTVAVEFPLSFAAGMRMTVTTKEFLQFDIAPS